MWNVIHKEVKLSYIVVRCHYHKAVIAMLENFKTYKLLLPMLGFLGSKIKIERKP